jgi:hypothetical protein
VDSLFCFEAKAMNAGKAQPAPTTNAGYRADWAFRLIQQMETAMFDSPIARCELVHQMVLTDQTQTECAREHECPPKTVCPLISHFTETSGIVDSDLLEKRPAH